MKILRNIYTSDIRSVNNPGTLESDTLLRIWCTTVPQMALNSHYGHWKPKMHFNWLNIPIVSTFQLLSTICYFHTSWGGCESHTFLVLYVRWVGDPAQSQMSLDICVGNIIKVGTYFGYTENLDTLDICINLYVVMKICYYTLINLSLNCILSWKTRDMR